MSVVGNIKSMTDGVDTLTKKVNELEGAIKTLSSSAEGAFKGVNGLLNEGGQRNVGRANRRPGTGADAATFSNGLPQPMGNTMTSSLAGFSQFGSPANAAAYAAATGNTAGMKGTAAVAGFQGVMQVASGMMSMVPDSSAVVNRATGYYQGTLRGGGDVSRELASKRFLNSMGGGLSGVGSDSPAFNILASAGFMPGSKDMSRAGAEIGGAAKYLGMDNSVAAGMIANAASGQTAAGLYQYGLSTWNQDGSKKSFGQIANDLSNVIFDKSKNFTAEGVQEAYRSGFTQQNLTAAGFGDAASQQAMQQIFVDLASGKKVDLANIKAPANNANPLDPYLQMNTSQTNLQQYVEKNTLQGLSTAADHVTKFNDAMKDVINSMASVKAYLDGMAGTNVGKGGKDVASGLMKVGGAIMMGVGAAVTIGSGGLASPLGLGLMAGGGAVYAASGGTPGYGGNFNTRTGGGRPGYGSKLSLTPSYTGGGTPGSSATVSAGYGVQGSQWDSTTGGTHLGVDYVRAKGTSVHAHADGVVSGDSISADYGNAVLIDHEGGFQTLYAHLNSKNVSPGTKVLAGQVIGTLGDSGKADGAHLHYEVRQGKNNPVDPSVMDAAYAGKMTLADVLGGNSSIGGNRSDYAFDALRGGGGGSPTEAPSGTVGGSGNSSPNPTGGYSADATSMHSWLMSQGLSSNGAFGVVANLLAESGLRTNANGDNGTSYGIAQWHKGRKDNLFAYAKENGLNPSSLEAQKGFLMKELSGSYGALLKTLQDPNVSQREATALFLRKFERPADQSDTAVDKRYNRGAGALKNPDSKTGGGTPGAGGAGLAPPSPTPSSQAALIESPTAQGGGTKNVYITVTVDQASHQQMVNFAEGVQKILEDKNHTVRMGM